ncbi:MAG: VanZ family protein [Patescibacteria group bacterium]
MKLFALAFFIFLVCFSIFAYVGTMPTAIKMIPYYDSVGHFLLFGILASAADLALQRKTTKIFGFTLSLGITLVIAFALIDESLQVLSSSRTFDLHDLSFGLVGILSFYLLGKLFSTKNPHI